MRRACLTLSLVILAASSAIQALIYILNWDLLGKPIVLGGDTIDWIWWFDYFVEIAGKLGFCLLGITLLVPRRWAPSVEPRPAPPRIVRRGPLVAMVPVFRAGLLVLAVLTGLLLVQRWFWRPWSTDTARLFWIRIGAGLHLLRYLVVGTLAVLGLVLLRRMSRRVGAGGVRHTVLPAREFNPNAAYGRKKFSYRRRSVLVGLAILTSCHAFFVLSDLSMLKIFRLGPTPFLMRLLSLISLSYFLQEVVLIFLCFRLRAWKRRKRPAPPVWRDPPSRPELDPY
jgi:hypothetical protein